MEAELLLLLATGYLTTNCPVFRDTGNQGDGSAAETCQQMQWDQKASPFSSCNIFRWGQRISFKTNKSDSSSLNEEMGELRTL